ncbi:Cytochrome C' [[Luteovulum] sphaeroides subsp. megalophilum]|nr:Cytochrome C' [[Luteovulum] sphaeroides subsp. megalophilum]
MAKGEVLYDAKLAKAHAADLVALATYSPDDLLVPGTSQNELPGKTRAKASFFEESEAYKAKGVAFYEAVMALDAVAANGQEALAPAVGKLGGTCKGCHDDHRSKDF